MSAIRLVILDLNQVQSGLIPARAISSLLYAVSQGSSSIKEFWEAIKKIDLGVHDYFQSNLDPSPILEGWGDGVLVISWEHKCVESFQGYQPLRNEGKVQKHNGSFLIEDQEKIEFSLGPEWHIIDHYFEESRH